MASSNKPQTSNPLGVKKTNPAYSHVCVTPILPSSKLITIAGQTGLRDEQSAAPDIKTQAEEACQALHAYLKAAGATPRDIIQARHYIVKETGDAEEDKKEVAHRDWYNVWVEFMDREGDGHRPPATAFGVSSLARKGLFYEVEVMAVVNE